MAVTSYYWNFGDGRYSTEQNPTHVYQLPGVYTVTLTIQETICGTLVYTFSVAVTDWDYAGGLNVSRTNRCLRLSLKPSRGFGWSEFGGAYWPFPEARVGTLKIVDDSSTERMLVFNRGGGEIYEVGVRDVYVDAYDGSSYGGYEVSCRLEFREEIGSSRHYFLRSIEHHPEFLPQNEDNKGESGYTAGGYRDAMEVHFALRKDGELTDTIITRDIPLGGDITFKYDDEAHRWQPIIYTTTSEWRLATLLNYYERLDKPAEPNKRVMSEQDYQTLLANTSVWLGRNSLAYAQNQTAGTTPALTNQATGLAFTGTYQGFSAGPDGRAGSAVSFVAGQGLTSGSAISLPGDFAVAFWARNPDGNVTVMDQVGGFVVSLIEVGDTYELRFSDSDGNEEDIAVSWSPTDWAMFVVQKMNGLIQMYHNTSLVMSRDIAVDADYSGQVRIGNNSECELFEPRLLNSTLVAGAVQHHYEDVTKHEGKATCVLF